MCWRRAGGRAWRGLQRSGKAEGLGALGAGDPVPDVGASSADGDRQAGTPPASAVELLFLAAPEGRSLVRQHDGRVPAWSTSRGISGAGSDLLTTVPAVSCCQKCSAVAGEQIVTFVCMRPPRASCVLGQLVLVARSVRLSTLVVFIQLSVETTSKIISLDHALGGQTSFFETDFWF